ncbi:hypothetical protein CDAR_175561 [Caerostris darwini]|uniref:Uncharacterized protein n=1 Tax=Caerostris darwini TaxID=1538125 RepID=A0AAV4S0X1_9ARAC|nr:hypothetical protein CDAR_175561 [Caerostris darwini]
MFQTFFFFPLKKNRSQILANNEIAIAATLNNIPKFHGDVHHQTTLPPLTQICKSSASFRPLFSDLRKGKDKEQITDEYAVRIRVLVNITGILVPPRIV